MNVIVMYFTVPFTIAYFGTFEEDVVIIIFFHHRVQ